MVVGERLVSRVMEFADGFGRAVHRDPERPRHAEMHDQHVARGKIGEEIFRPAAEAGDGLVLEARGEVLREGKAQVGAARLDLAKRMPSMTGMSPLRTVSTSGSSGTFTLS
jgi:hypothetical protein